MRNEIPVVVLFSSFLRILYQFSNSLLNIVLLNVINYSGSFSFITNGSRISRKKDLRAGQTNNYLFTIINYEASYLL